MHAAALANGAKDADLSVHRDQLDSELWAPMGEEALDQQALLDFLKGR